MLHIVKSSSSSRRCEPSGYGNGDDKVLLVEDAVYAANPQHACFPS